MTAEQPRASAAPGTVVGARYRLESLLGEGGMAVVWKALHTETDRPVALKLVRRELVTEDAVRDMFVREARVAARIGQNPHIVDVLDAGVDAELGVPFMAMELLAGEPLDARIRREGPVAWELAARFTGEIADALDQAHQAGVFHRDLKPQNLFLARTKKGELIKVVDFGIAKLAETVQQSSTHVGTPAYSAPEQLGPSWRSIAEQQGRTIATQISAATDVWALGLCVYEMLTGTASGALWGATTLAELPVKIVLEPPPVPSRRAGERAVLLPAGFDGWLGRCLELDASRRFASAGEAARALEGLAAPGARSADARSVPPAMGASARQPSQPAIHVTPARPNTPPSALVVTPGRFGPGGYEAPGPHPAGITPHSVPPVAPTLPAQSAPTPPQPAHNPPMGPGYAPAAPYPAASPVGYAPYPPASIDPRLAAWAQHRRAQLTMPDPRFYMAWSPIQFLSRVGAVYREAQLTMNDAPVRLAEVSVDEALRKAVGEDRVVLAFLSSPRVLYRAALRSRAAEGLAESVNYGIKLIDSLVGTQSAKIGDPVLEREFEIAFPTPQEGAMALPLSLRSLLVNGRFRGVLELRQGGIVLWRSDVRHFDPTPLDRLLDTLSRVYAVFGG